MALLGFLFAVSSICANRFLDVLAPNNDLLICGLTTFVNGWLRVRGRNCDAVEICRHWIGRSNALRAIGFAAVKAPFGIDAIVFCIVEYDCILRGIRNEEEGRSRMKSGMAAG